MTSNARPLAWAQSEIETMGGFWRTGSIQSRPELRGRAREIPQDTELGEVSRCSPAALRLSGVAVAGVTGHRHRLRSLVGILGQWKSRSTRQAQHPRGRVWNARSLAEEPILWISLDGTVVRVRLDSKATALRLLLVIGCARATRC
jgi:hypothetical protein